MMKSRFKLSETLMAAALVVSALALPTAGRAQATGSNGSLADTLTWLTSFLPTATGAYTPNPSNSIEGAMFKENIDVVSGCNIRSYEDALTYKNGVVVKRDRFTYAYSISDVEPSSIIARIDPLAGTISIHFNTRGNAPLVQIVLDDAAAKWWAANGFSSSQAFGGFDGFVDMASAQRVANAFQHAAQLCANAQPFLSGPGKNKICGGNDEEPIQDFGKTDGRGAAGKHLGAASRGRDPGDRVQCVACRHAYLAK